MFGFLFVCYRVAFLTLWVVLSPRRPEQVALAAGPHLFCVVFPFVVLFVLFIRDDLAAFCLLYLLACVCLYVLVFATGPHLEAAARRVQDADE